MHIASTVLASVRELLTRHTKHITLKSHTARRAAGAAAIPGIHAHDRPRRRQQRARAADDTRAAAVRARMARARVGAVGLEGAQKLAVSCSIR